MDEAFRQRQLRRFFAARKTPSRKHLDELAHALTGALLVSPIATAVAASYSVVCSGCPAPTRDQIVSFREPVAPYHEGMVKLARELHGGLVEELTCLGPVLEGEPPWLLHYSVPCQRGTPACNVLPRCVELSPGEEAKLKAFVEQLAEYAAQCFESPMEPLNDTLPRQQEAVRRRLTLLKEQSPGIVPEARLSKLLAILPELFARKTSIHVLTHNDLSLKNILVDAESLKMLSIVDWSITGSQPFGTDLQILHFATGYMSRDGWRDYTCKKRLLDAFWKEFWAFSDNPDKAWRFKVQRLATYASQIAAIQRLAFRLDPFGSPSEVISVSSSARRQLSAWFGGEEVEEEPPVEQKPVDKMLVEDKSRKSRKRVMEFSPRKSVEEAKARGEPEVAGESSAAGGAGPS